MSTRQQFDEELRRLESELIRMGTAATNAVSLAMQALKNLDKQLAREIIKEDASINAMERDIETMCLKLILKQQPVATDLRKISTAIKMITDIERIGDAAADIAEISMFQNSFFFPDVLEEIFSMAAAAKDMVASAIDAYVSGDLELAAETIDKDDIVDDYFLKIRTELGSRIYNNPTETDKVIDYLMIIKYLERVGDHAVNICEWVQFYVTGIHNSERIL